MVHVYWDAMLFVYWLEDHPRYAHRVGQIHAGMQARGDRLCTSIFTVAEVLTGPNRDNDTGTAAAFAHFFQAPEIELLPFTLATADQYARIRGHARVQPADAIHLAAAAEVGATLFLTHDRRLIGRRFEGIDIIAGLDINVY
ncbi:MAG TPA: PIN domain-containing protein [Terriglobales bacterium]|nr:PIN domain-containing protein [Terriglobales bacterium]